MEQGRRAGEDHAGSAVAADRGRDGGGDLPGNRVQERRAQRVTRRYRSQDARGAGVRGQYRLF